MSLLHNCNVVDGVPLDGSPLTLINTFNTALVAVFDTLAILGISFTIGCLLFNFIFRRTKLVNVSDVDAGSLTSNYKAD